ncbi:MAG TPA: hypothetical protein VFQ61_32360, partial [Polyangiaceae bacterium]|nr:hypothetical protein [Polyangiaceae bacterium]
MISNHALVFKRHSCKRHWLLFACGVVGGLFTAPGAAHAEDTAPAAAALSDATKAYEEVDYARAYELGRVALNRGQASVGDSVRLYTLLGISAAALGKTDEARRYFITALAIDPARELEQSLSPRVRAPYLEAKGTLSLYKEPIRLLARMQRSGTYLVVRLEDPLALIKSLAVQTRNASTTAAPADEPEVELPAQPENRVLIASTLAGV